MNVKYTLAFLLTLITSQPVLAATGNGLELDESEIHNIINGNMAKVQASRQQAIEQQKQPVKPIQRQVVKQPVARPAPTPVRAPVAPRRVDLSSIPAWRRPAGYTMTRSADDALFGAAKSRNLNLLKQLVAEGANVNHQNFNGETALHIAASLGNLQMIQYLIGRGANLHARTGTQWMPIHHAIRFNHVRVANYLISRKASLTQKTIDGFTPLDFAKKSKNPHIQAIARKYGG
ncbi:MAG: ankyrin repeat domain-containing protein [Cocleimonas sp.]|nr:ankyrin repeat domain-containing protein [Cocleimonas sp.]